MARVVRMSSQNRQRPINLLSQHHSRKLMRQRHAPQRQQNIAPLTPRRRPSIRRPHCQHHPLRPFIPKPPQQCRKLLRTVLFPETIQHNRIGRHPARLLVQPFQQQRLRIEHPCLARNVPRGPLHIVVDQTIRCVTLIPCPPSPNRCNRNLHSAPQSRFRRRHARPVRESSPGRLARRTLLRSGSNRNRFLPARLRLTRSRFGDRLLHQ